MTKRWRRPEVTVLLILLGASLPYFVPGLARFVPVKAAEAIQAFSLPFRPSPLARIFVPRADSSSSPEREEASTREPEAPPTVSDQTRPSGTAPQQASGAPHAVPLPEPSESDVRDIEDPCGELHSFFAKLERTRRGEPGAVTRISHFGDSPLTGDLISGEARARFQRAFGDAGHGFVLPARPWGWYGHQRVTLNHSGWHFFSPLLTPGNGGIYGLSGVVATTSGQAESSVSLDRSTFTRLSLTYTRRPRGGRVLVTIDGGPTAEVSTAGETREPAVWEGTAPSGARAVSLRTRGDGEVTIHGLVLENDGPGVVYDALGANGASVFFLKRLDETAWEQELASRGSDLVILSYGTNESGYAGIPGPSYRRDYAEIVSRVRRALPKASILLMAPMDRGQRTETGQIVTMPSVPEIVKSQRQVAQEAGAAFFDTFSAMGGEGTMARWFSASPRLVTGDFTHTTRKGSDRVAQLLVSALEKAYLQWRSDQKLDPPSQDRPAAPLAALTP